MKKRHFDRQEQFPHISLTVCPSKFLVINEICEAETIDPSSIFKFWSTNESKNITLLGDDDSALHIPLLL